MTPEDIIAEVVLVTGIPAPVITGKRRSKRITQARFLAAAAIREVYDWWTLETTAKFFNRLDHGTIANARRRHLELLKSDLEYKALATQICRNLFARPSR
jgi:chromosomal replication initiation ATPase DnaA